MKAFLVLAFFICFCTAASATNLRGQLIRYNPAYGQNFPLAGIRVDLMVWNGAQWLDLAYSVTGADGIYAFYNVAPGATFQIMVFGQFKLGQPMGVAAIAAPYFEDIPVIST